MRLVPQIQEPFSFHLIPTKGCLLLCSALPLVSIRTRNEGSREGRSSCQVQAEKKNLSLSLFVWFSVELISALLISGWYSSRSSSPRGRERGEKEKWTKTNNYFHHQPPQERQAYTTHISMLAYECARSSPQRIDKRKKINNKINKKMNKQKLSPWGCPSHQTRKD